MHVAYRKIMVYYFTGTGNSGKVVEWITEIAKTEGVEVVALNLAQIDRIHIDKPGPRALLIFTSPIHGFNFPPIMMHFIMRFPKGNNKVVLMNTRAGMRIGKFITPGLTGIAFYFSTLFLIIKGYSIKGLFPVDMPSNWLSLHPNLGKKTAQYLHIKNKKKVQVFVSKMITGKPNYKALYEIIQDVLILPIAVLYYFIGRFFLAKTFYASSDCNNCGMCIRECPVKAMKSIGGRPFWTLNCESCMKCMSHCPQQAIETGHGFVIAFSVAYYGFLFGLIYFWIEKLFFEIHNSWLLFIIKSVFFILLLTVFYRLVHYLFRYRFFSKIVEYTSATRYPFWGGRYSALKDEEFDENGL